MDTQTTPEGVLTMGNLPLNSLAVQQQATGAIQKNSEHFAHYLLTIPTRRTKRASSKQPALQKIKKT
jgi:hypothetical protein